MLWNKVGYLRPGEGEPYEYRLCLPRPLADWDVFDYWERERILSMQSLLTEDDVLVDVGAESGWMSIVFGQMVGPENMVLIEPTALFWPNIRQTWEHNFNTPPLAAWRGLFAADSNDPVFDVGWPVESEGELSDVRAYTYLHEHPQCPRTRIDDWITATGITPTALTIDVEGAEHEILLGAVDLLTTVRPKVWISIHPDLMWKNYRRTPGDLFALMDGFGYKPTWLATDHEIHYTFMPRR